MILQCGKAICSECSKATTLCEFCNSIHEWAATEFLDLISYLDIYIITCYKQDHNAIIIDKERFLGMCQTCKSISTNFIEIDDCLFINDIDILMNEYDEKVKNQCDSQIIEHFLHGFSLNQQAKLEKIRWMQQYLTGNVYCIKHPDVLATGINKKTLKFYCGCKTNNIELFTSSEYNKTLNKLILHKLRYTNPLSNNLIGISQGSKFEIHKAVMEISLVNDILTPYHKCPYCLGKFGSIEPIKIKCISEIDEIYHYLCKQCANINAVCKIDQGKLDKNSIADAKLVYSTECCNCKNLFNLEGGCITINIDNEEYQSDENIPHILPCYHKICFKCINDFLLKHETYHCKICNLYFPNTILPKDNITIELISKNILICGAHKKNIIYYEVDSERVKLYCKNCGIKKQDILCLLRILEQKIIQLDNFFNDIIQEENEWTQYVKNIQSYSNWNKIIIYENYKYFVQNRLHGISEFTLIFSEQEEEIQNISKTSIKFQLNQAAVLIGIYLTECNKNGIFVQIYEERNGSQIEFYNFRKFEDENNEFWLSTTEVLYLHHSCVYEIIIENTSRNEAIHIIRPSENIENQAFLKSYTQNSPSIVKGLIFQTV